MVNHPNRAPVLAIIDETDGGKRRCLPATAEKIQNFSRLQEAASLGRVVMDSADGWFGGARTAREAAKLAEMPVSRIVKGIFRTYAPNGLGEVVELPAWIVT